MSAPCAERAGPVGIDRRERIGIEDDVAGRRAVGPPRLNAGSVGIHVRVDVVVVWVVRTGKAAAVEVRPPAAARRGLADPQLIAALHLAQASAEAAMLDIGSD